MVLVVPWKADLIRRHESGMLPRGFIFQRDQQESRWSVLNNTAQVQLKSKNVLHRGISQGNTQRDSAK